MPIGPETQKNRRNTSEEAQAVQTYLNYMKLPNIHVGIHYPVQANEYGTPANSNVLITSVISFLALGFCSFANY
jgi:hypothetical protein